MSDEANFELDVYPVKPASPGIAFIINNLHHDEKHIATRNDVTRFQEVFTTMNITMEEDCIMQDLGKPEMEILLKDLENRDFGQHSMFFLVLISHGGLRGKLMCPNLSPDGKPVNYSLIETDKLAESLGKNKSLNGRPKIIILDCCRGNELNVGQTKSSGSVSQLREVVPFGSDIFLGFATSNGFVSATTEVASPFLRDLADCLELYYKKKSWQGIFQRVQGKVWKVLYRSEEGERHVQIPESRSTLRKKLYFSPKERSIV